jgi:hypothetical protein
MRTISEATQAILKGQNLISQDKYNYELKLEGYDAGYSDIQNTITVDLKQNISFLDYEIRADGKVLAAYVNASGEVRLSTIDSEDVMLSVNNAVPDGDLFTTVIGGPNPISLLRLNNGRILLFVATIGNATDVPYSVKAYESANGLGTDFALKSTIFSFQRPHNNMWGDHLRASVSKTMVMDDGSIFIAIAYPFSDSGYYASGIRIYKSTDNGGTWTQLFQYTSGGIYWLSGWMGVKSICYHGDSIWVIHYLQYGTVYQYICLSTNKGATWTAINTVNGWAGQQGNTFQFDTTRDNAGNLFLVSPLGNIYTAKPSDTVDFNFLNTPANWTLKVQTVSFYEFAHAFLSVSPRGNIHFISTQLNKVCDVGMIRELYSAPFPASSISISKGRGGANTASIGADNLNGALNPKNPDSELYGILGTNKQVIIKQGYGSDLIEAFTGMIDGFDMSTWPQTTNILLRDNLKKALDQTVTYGTQHTIAFELQPIENIVGYLCYLAGIEVGDIEETGIQVAKTFSWESYADCFQFLGDLASFEWGCDEYGKFYFRRDYQPDNMYVAYTFEEGVDIESLRYTIKDDDLYYKVAVFGKAPDGTVISYEAPFLDASTYNLMPQKILKIDATEATTTAELRKIAERAIALMQSRTAVVNFSSIGVPWLQVGDFIGVYERSTGAASIYRISSLKLDMDSDSFTMNIDAYYYGDSIVPGELPTDEATQTVAPSTNIIPEMTSNTAPSGVARASSVYTSAYEPWQAFNSTDADLYWNAITNTGWIEYQFPEKMIVDKYSLKARQATEYNDAMPKAWTFEGFDGSAWVVLDTRSAQTAWGINEVRTFLFTNTTTYSKYRLNVSVNNGYNRLQLEQLAMYYGGGS